MVVSPGCFRVGVSYDVLHYKEGILGILEVSSDKGMPEGVRLFPFDTNLLTPDMKVGKVGDIREHLLRIAVVEEVSSGMGLAVCIESGIENWRDGDRPVFLGLGVSHQDSFVRKIDIFQADLPSFDRTTTRVAAKQPKQIPGGLDPEELFYLFIGECVARALILLHVGDILGPIEAFKPAVVLDSLDVLIVVRLALRGENLVRKGSKSLSI